MKKQFLILSAFLISMTVFGQKNELKASQKALDAKDFARALSEANKAESLLTEGDQKSTAKCYYLQALALYQNGAANADLEKVSEAFNKVISYEKKTKVKYSTEINDLSQKLVQSTVANASDLYKVAVASEADEDYSKAAEKFHLVYKLSPIDTLYLDNAALLYTKGKNYDKSIELYNKLLDLNYTGIQTVYIATSKADGKDVIFSDKSSMDTQVKLKLATNPRTEVKESRRIFIFRYLADNYSAMDNIDKALEVLAQGREEYPDSYEMLIAQANVYYKKGDKEMFKQLLEKAISIHPEDPNLYYNVGVMNMDQGNRDEAIEYFEKAIELKPDFAAAYQNIGTAIIDKTIPIVEEMNKSLSDFNKYDKLLAQQKEIYKEALPYYEKALELDGENIAVIQTLLGLYENLEMTEKHDALKVVYDKLK